MWLIRRSMKRCLRALQAFQWLRKQRVRTLLSSKFLSSEASVAMNNISYHLVWINLNHRVDRRVQFEGELRRLRSSSTQRFEAIFSQNGALGCALSHAAVLRAWDGGAELLMVCEDDVQFLKGPAELHNLIFEFALNPHLDVLALGSSVLGTFVPVSAALAITNETQTTSCYILKSRARDVLLRDFERSSRLLARGVSSSRAAIDVLWKRTQQSRLIFCVPRETMVRQRPSFSDIENNYVAYN